MLVQTIFGWPFIILSLLVSGIGLIKDRYLLLLIGAVLIFPFSFYLSGAPEIRGLAFGIPLSQVYAAYTIKKEKTIIAWLLTLPAFFASIWVAFNVLSQ